MSEVKSKLEEIHTRVWQTAGLPSMRADEILDMREDRRFLLEMVMAQRGEIAMISAELRKAKDELSRSL